jgi:hypothetical protein
LGGTLAACVGLLLTLIMMAILANGGRLEQAITTPPNIAFICVAVLAGATLAEVIYVQLRPFGQPPAGESPWSLEARW